MEDDGGDAVESAEEETMTSEKHSHGLTKGEIPNDRSEGLESAYRNQKPQVLNHLSAWDVQAVEVQLAKVTPYLENFRFHFRYVNVFVRLTSKIYYRSYNEADGVAGAQEENSTAARGYRLFGALGEVALFADYDCQRMMCWRRRNDRKDCLASSRAPATGSHHT
ncbi:hypothetical protein N7493_010631 [Penicillium malachiteum]|uniref:Uncharacterized protein n=1 Tax=Penicillium malachiteum TaxID=1324776 RepID=A0AAD6MRN9_9EURO|nr:hypothetical protein N7493_010631 [Penicillium malachiteum]